MATKRRTKVLDRVMVNPHSSANRLTTRGLRKLYSIGLDALAPGLGLETTACVLVGMGALSAAIVGGPLTMTFLVRESKSTGNLGVAGGVLAASIVTTLAV